MVNPVKEYAELYGDVPIDEVERMKQHLSEESIRHTRRKLSDEIQRISGIAWKEVSFTIYLIPKATPRPRLNPVTHTFYVSGAKGNKEIFKKEFVSLDLDTIITPTIYDAKSYLPMPKSMRKMDQILGELGFIRPIRNPDWDNLAKTYTDMIVHTLLYNDNLIIDGRLRKYYSWKPRIEITLKYMEDFDCEFNRKNIMKGGD